MALEAPPMVRSGTARAAFELPQEVGGYEDPETFALFLQTTMGTHEARGGQSAESLYNSLGIEAASRELAEGRLALSSQDYDELRWATASRVAKGVSEAFWCTREGLDPLTGKTPAIESTFSGRAIANCYGQTWVASKCLELIGLRHWIGYANGHAFLLLPSEAPGEAKLWFVDPMSPRLSRCLAGATIPEEVAAAAEDIDRYRDGAIQLWTTYFEDPKYPHESLEALVGWHPWLAVGGSKYAHRDTRTRLMARVYDAAVGREVLGTHALLAEYLEAKDYDAAKRCLGALRSRYPEIDGRTNHKTIKTLVQGLCAAGDTAGAQAAIEDYFADVERFSTDPRITKQVGDCLSILAVAGGVPHEDALAAYDAAIQASRSPYVGALAMRHALEQRVGLRTR